MPPLAASIWGAACSLNEAQGCKTKNAPLPAHWPRNPTHFSVRNSGVQICIAPLRSRLGHGSNSAVGWLPETLGKSTLPRAYPLSSANVKLLQFPGTLLCPLPCYPSNNIFITMPGLKPPSPALSAARQTVERAFKDLERTIAPAESRDFSSTTLDDVRKAAIEVERQLAARQSLRNTRRLDPLFKGLEHYAKIIEVLANGTDYLPWIWAPIKLILKVAADYVEAFERIIKAYSDIADSLHRFQRLELSFRDKPEIYPTFAVFYADILSFHKAAYKFVTRPCTFPRYVPLCSLLVYMLNCW